MYSKVELTQVGSDGARTMTGRKCEELWPGVVRME